MPHAPAASWRAKTFVEGPVDYTDLRTEFIGLIYEGLLDYRLKRTDAAVPPGTEHRHFDLDTELSHILAES